jgi:hypothetical protein
MATLNAFLIFGLLLGTLALFGLLLDPYRLRRRSRLLWSRFLSPRAQEDLGTLVDAWAGRRRIRRSQQHVLAALAFVVGAAATLLLASALGQAGLLLGGLLTLLLAYYPYYRFQGGFSRSLLAGLEEEAAKVAQFAYIHIGIARNPLAVMFADLARIHADLATARLVAGLPAGARPAEALLAYSFPPTAVPDWLEVMEVLNSLDQDADKRERLRAVVQTMRKRRISHLRRLAKSKAMKSMMVTVTLCLLVILNTLLTPTVAQAVRNLGGRFG